MKIELAARNGRLFSKEEFNKLDAFTQKVIESPSFIFDMATIDLECKGSYKNLFFNRYKELIKKEFTWKKRVLQKKRFTIPK